MPADIVSIIATGGAAGAFFYVLKWLVDGKLHTSSEVSGKDDQIEALLEINKRQADALLAANATMSALIQAGRTGSASPQ